jgi:diaminopimelate epimerase
LGSDGIVVLLERDPADGIFPLAMFNPDGSAFERSGNGLRVLGAYLLEEGLVPVAEDGSSASFFVRTG